MTLWPYATPGIPDEMFERQQGVPITKEEVRAVQISKARIKLNDTIYDVGCGTGSVSVEAAIQAGAGGRVFGIDHDMAAIGATKNNAKIFGLQNIQAIHGEAADVLPDLPTADVIMVGGTGGDTADILKFGAKKMAPGGRIVIGTILVETLVQVLDAIKFTPLQNVDITQVTVLKSRRTSTGTMMLARNPVTIVAASAPL